MITPPPIARVIETTVSNEVSKSKCDGTPRHTCMVTSAVSTTHAPVNTPSSTARVRSGSATNEVAHVTASRVSPNESPNVAALRYDNGPSHESPLEISTQRWTTPLVHRSAPTAYATWSTTGRRATLTGGADVRVMTASRPSGPPLSSSSGAIRRSTAGTT